MPAGHAPSATSNWPDLGGRVWSWLAILGWIGAIFAIVVWFQSCFAPSPAQGDPSARLQVTWALLQSFLLYVTPCVCCALVCHSMSALIRMSRHGTTKQFGTLRHVWTRDVRSDR